MIVERRFSHIPQDGRRGRAWVASLAPLFDARLDEGATPPPGAFQLHHHLGEAVLSIDHAPAQTVERTDRLVEEQGLDHLLLRCHSQGTVSVAVDGSCREAAPGDIVAIDLGRPVRIRSGPTNGVGIVLPRRVLAGADGAAAVRHGQILGVEGDPSIRLLSGHLLNLAAYLAASPALQTGPLGPVTTTLCRCLVGIPAGADVEPPPEGRRAEIGRFIEENLGTVDVQTVAARFGVSSRSLYRLFPDGGVSSFIRGRRLAHAMRELSRRSTDRPRKIVGLAHACGFTDPRVFSRAFHRRYGVWPGDVRGGGPIPLPGVAEGPPMAWLRDL